MGIRESELQVIARINDQEAIKNLVAQGLGISILSERAARNFCEEKRLLGFELPESAARRCLYPVSYTHLDVYKRQPATSSNLPENKRFRGSFTLSLPLPTPVWLPWSAHGRVSAALPTACQGPGMWESLAAGAVGGV